MTSTALELRVAQAFQSVLNVSTLGVDDNFFDVGGNPVLAMSLIARLQPLTSKRLLLTTLIEAPSIASMTRRIRGEFRPLCGGTVACIQPGSDGCPIVFSHAVGGTVLFYHELASHLGTNRAVYALQAQGVNIGEVPIPSIEAMATKYLSALSAEFGGHDYQLGAYSFGCLVVLEMARQAEAQGIPVRELILVAPPELPLPSTQITRLSDHAAGREALKLLDAFRKREEVNLSRSIERQLLKLYKANLIAEAAYVPAKIQADFLLVLPEMDSQHEPTWQRWTSGAYRTILAPGDHISMIRVPGVERWAGTLLSEL